MSVMIKIIWSDHILYPKVNGQLHCDIKNPFLYHNYPVINYIIIV